MSSQSGVVESLSLTRLHLLGRERTNEQKDDQAHSYNLQEAIQCGEVLHGTPEEDRSGYMHEVSTYTISQSKSSLIVCESCNSREWVIRQCLDAERST